MVRDLVFLLSVTALQLVPLGLLCNQTYVCMHMALLTQRLRA
jgi:hypothetical protein